MATSNAVSTCLRFSSNAPHKFAKRLLSAGVEEISIDLGFNVGRCGYDTVILSVVEILCK